MPDGVVEQVVHRTAEPLAVGLDDDRLDRPDRARSRRVEPARVDRLGDELVEAHVLAFGGVRRLAVAGQRDQVGDEQPELVGLRDDVVKDLVALAGGEVRLRSEHLGVRAHARHRRTL